MAHNKYSVILAAVMDYGNDDIIMPSWPPVSMCIRVLIRIRASTAPRALWEGPGPAEARSAQARPGLPPRCPFSCGVSFCGAGRCFQNDASIFLRSTSNQKRLPDGALV